MVQEFRNGFPEFSALSSHQVAINMLPGLHSHLMKTNGREKKSVFVWKHYLTEYEILG